MPAGREGEAGSADAAQDGRALLRGKVITGFQQARQQLGLGGEGAGRARPMVTVCRDTPVTSMRSPALISPRDNHSQVGSRSAPRAVNLFTHFGSFIRCANVAPGMRGEVACRTTVPPIRQRSPTSVPVRSRPRVVRFSPNWRAGSSYPKSRSHQVQVLTGVGVHGLVRAAVMLGRANDVTGQAVRPRVTPPLADPVSETGPGQLTGCLPMPVRPVSCGVGSVWAARLTDSSTPRRDTSTNLEPRAAATPLATH